MKKERPDLLTTLKINKETHKRVKDYCDENDYYMCRFVETILNDYLDQNKKL